MDVETFRLKFRTNQKTFCNVDKIITGLLFYKMKQATKTDILYSRENQENNGVIDILSNIEYIEYQEYKLSIFGHCFILHFLKSSARGTTTKTWRLMFNDFSCPWPDV